MDIEFQTFYQSQTEKIDSAGDIIDVAVSSVPNSA